MRRGLQRKTLTLPHSRDLGRKPKEDNNGFTPELSKFRREKEDS